MRISDWSSDVCSSDLMQNLTLSGSHRIEALDHRGFRPPRGIHRNGRNHGVMQCLGPYRLGEKVHSASLHRLDSHGDVAVASQEDNRLGITVSGESTLQVETARSRRAHIEDQAAGAVQYVGFKQFARRAKADRLEAR